MKIPTTQTRHFRSIVSQPLLALAFASVISALAMMPALAEDHDNRQGNWNHGRGHGGYHGKGHGYHDEWHGYHGERHRYHGEWHGYRPPYYYYRRPPRPNAYIYPPPLYPPPVYYAPFPSPGINLVFPIEIR